jgi:hypothetical protein
MVAATSPATCEEQAVNTVMRFVLYALAFGILVYLVKGRDAGLPLWVALLLAPIILGINFLGGHLTDRYKGE